jgi:1-acyl-sn-glycerol-3-phosphate acyltransferase
LFLSNHVSYLDVFVLGRYVPAFFIAKSEVSGWPIFGWLVKRQNTLFFERNSKKVCHQMAIMSEHFNQQNNLILFPEGTSTDGVHVKAFKSSLLQSVESADREVMIQPITLAYTRYQNKMMSRKIRDQYAWYAKMPFVSHFFSVLGLGRAELELIFHQPVTLADFESRKDCAQYCQSQVSLGLANALRDSH